MQDTIAKLCNAALRVLDRWTDVGPLVVRIVFGYFWFETGLAKVQNLDGFTNRFVDGAFRSHTSTRHCPPGRN